MYNDDRKKKKNHYIRNDTHYLLQAFDPNKMLIIVFSGHFMSDAPWTRAGSF